MTAAADKLIRAAQRVSERQHSLAEVCRQAIHDGWTAEHTHELVRQQVRRLDDAWDRHQVIENQIEDGLLPDDGTATA